MLLDIKADGYLTITIIHENGKREVVSGKNIVVNNAVTLLTKAISQGNKYKIDYLALGTGSGEKNINTFRLSNQVLRTPIVDQRYPNGHTVEFKAVLGKNEGNGTTFTEAGLIASGADVGEGLFAVRNTGGIQKNNQLELEYTWVIIITRGA